MMRSSPPRPPRGLRFNDDARYGRPHRPRENELGYARLELPSGRAVSVIDVPGHERFVRTMVAGATGVDLYLMTVAADDGVMPQTREHAAVLRALGVSAGVVAVTKSDLADPEVAMIEAAELLPGVEVVPVSARTEAGLDQLRGALDRAAAVVSRPADAGASARLHIDRVFTIRGAGTVVTGTLWSGAIGRGDELSVLPSGRRVRVRAAQVHDRPVERATAGQRVGVNLIGVAVDHVRRGDVLVAADSQTLPTYLLDAQLEFGRRDPEHGERVQVHHGTRESPARLAWLGGDFWQVRLEQPLVPELGDRVVVRQIAPADTLGGGVVLDPHPRKHGPSGDALIRLERVARGESPEQSAPPAPARAARSEPPPLSASALALERRLKDARFEPPRDAELDPEDLAALRGAGRAVRVSKSLHYHPDALTEVRRRVLEIADRSAGKVTLGQLRDRLGTSRKFAQALLEHLDSERVLIRRGDAHLVRRGAGDPRTPDASRTDQ
jgi:selenocysteine-specific elongation factor